jgi:hypothetical protein
MFGCLQRYADGVHVCMRSTIEATGHGNIDPQAASRDIAESA